MTTPTARTNTPPAGAAARNRAAVTVIDHALTRPQRGDIRDLLLDLRLILQPATGAPR